MPRDFTFSFTFGGERFDDVVMTWGLDRRRLRCSHAEARGEEWDWSRESWIPDPRERDGGVGWTVDVPDVLAMLDEVQAGRASVDDLRSTLLALTQEPSKKSGCCVDCDAAVEEYAAEVGRRDRARARFDDTDRYPLLVTQAAIHSWDCYHFTGQLPEGAGSSVSDYVHNVRTAGRDPELARLTADEAVTWMDSRTGPRAACAGGDAAVVSQPALPGRGNRRATTSPPEYVIIRSMSPGPAAPVNAG